jgi:hypothetical protein
MAGEVDREALIAAGWRQGAVIDREHASPDHPAGHFVILNQTCDILNGSLSAEPTVELLPLFLKPGKNKPDPNLANGFNPRKIDFEVTLHGKAKWHSANIGGLVFLPREKLLECLPSGAATVEAGTLASLLNWRIARYTRTAFPESFEKAWKKKKDDLGQAVASGDHLIDSMLISLEPFDEISPDEQYVIEIILLVTPPIYSNPVSVLALQRVARDLQAHLGEISEFISPKCVVLPLDEVSLWDRRKYRDFSRYDYLSFGEGTAKGTAI